ncbi:MAG: nicotinamide riboside transporter PnuC [Bacteroidales bacterium]
MDILEIMGVTVGLAYLYWEFYVSKWLWLAGLVMPAIYIVVYARAGFYADMGINIYYLFASLYGFVVWLNKPIQGKLPLKVHRTPLRLWLPLAAVALVLWVGIYLLLICFTDSSLAIGDSFTTALSIVALWMLTNKYAEQWLLWILVDVVCVYLYASKGLMPTAALYALYTLIAVFGYLKWCNLAKEK